MLDNAGGSGPVVSRELVVDPRWRVFAITVDGKSLPVLRIEHPRHGDIDCLLTDESVLGISQALGRMHNDRMS